jgi:hypothetical protein
MFRLCDLNLSVLIAAGCFVFSASPRTCSMKCSFATDSADDQKVGSRSVANHSILAEVSQKTFLTGNIAE